MKFNYLLLLAFPLALAACQGNEAPTAAVPAVQSSAPASNAMEVKKPAVSNTGKAMQAGLQQGQQHSAAAVAELAKDVADKPVAVKEKLRHAVAPAKKAAAAVKPVALPAPIKTPPVKAPQTPSPAAAKPAPMPTVQAAMGDAAKGAKTAKKCKACHNFDARKKVGPGLAGIFGRKAGAMTDMKYGASLAAGGWSWDAEHLAAWVCDSKQAIKAFTGNTGAKTKMGNQRICDPTKQADLIAYLKTL